MTISRSDQFDYMELLKSKTFVSTQIITLAGSTVALLCVHNLWKILLWQVLTSASTFRMVITFILGNSQRILENILQSIHKLWATSGSSLKPKFKDLRCQNTGSIVFMDTFSTLLRYVAQVGNRKGVPRRNVGSKDLKGSERMFQI